MVAEAWGWGRGGGSRYLSQSSPIYLHRRPIPYHLFTSYGSQFSSVKIKANSPVLTLFNASISIAPSVSVEILGNAGTGRHSILRCLKNLLHSWAGLQTDRHNHILSKKEKIKCPL